MGGARWEMGMDYMWSYPGPAHQPQAPPTHSKPHTLMVTRREQ